MQEDWHVKHDDTIDALFIGNSRIYQMVDIPYIESKTKLNYYSLSQGSRNSKILYYKYLEYLKRNNKPKYVFLQFDPFFCGMDLTKGTFNGKQSYLAYLYHDRLGINHLFKEEKGFSILEEYIPLLRYFKSGIKGPYMLVSHLFNLKPYKKELFKDGVEVENKNWDKSTSWSNPEVPNFVLNFNYIDSFRSICKSKNIHLILIYPPQSKPSYKKTDTSVLNLFMNYSNDKKVELWNFNDDKYDNSQLFYNHMHLNRKGVNEFRSDLVLKIKELMK